MFAIIDVETTGLNFHRESLTEVAVILFDGQEVLQEWSRLIHPGRSIPYEISRLTGITNEMVADAPQFFEVAREVVLMTEDCTLVGHNVGFDYAFLREEFRRLGYVYQRKTLCTVRMSRKAFPGLRSYSLPNLCASLDIPRTIHHRAGEDAKATFEVFTKVLSVRPDLVHGSNAPVDAGLRKDILGRLPEGTGIYYLHDEKGDVIYVGKSTNIRQRVSDHFANDKTIKGLNMREKVRDVGFEITGSETLALLRESAEIKALMPLYNQKGRRKIFTTALIMQEGKDGYLRLSAKRLKEDQDNLALFSSMAEAKGLLETLCERHQLCQKLCGLYKSTSACFHHGIGQCLGACIGAETPASYNERVMKAVGPYVLDERSFFIIDRGRHEQERSLILIRQGQYAGYTHVDQDMLSSPPGELCSLVTRQPSDRDTQQIITACLGHHRYLGLLDL